MNYETHKIFLTFFLATVASSCSQDNQSNSGIDDNDQLCYSEAKINYICGPLNAEDLLSLGDTGMILTSGMNGTLDGSETDGHIYLINPIDKSWADLVSGPNFSQNIDSDSYPECPGPLDIDDYSAHGLALKEMEKSYFDLYITSHGAREAIEIFTLDMRDAEAKLIWKGCVPLDESIMHNSLAILSDGGFVTTQFMTWAGGVESAFSGEARGSLVIWRPGGQPTIMSDSELGAPNGIVISDDERYIFVAAFATSEIVRFDLTKDPIEIDSSTLDILPDNVRWGRPGMLLTAGGNIAGDGWSVIEIDAQTMESSRITSMNNDTILQGASSALQVENTIWVGTYSGDRIGYFERE
tara:strand:- start:457 stop:1518 length:1062 start_codon:yes stop_codon:yes gene_type:complete